MFERRSFLRGLAGSTAAILVSDRMWRDILADESTPSGVSIREPHSSEDIFAYLTRVDGQFDADRYKKILGAANEFKEGDQIIGVAAADAESRMRARQLLGNTRLSEIDRHPPHTDQLFELLRQSTDQVSRDKAERMTCGELKQFVLKENGESIRELARGLSSDVIGCLVKLMTNQELIAVGAKVFNPLPNSRVGAKGYLGARIQPNSPTDNVDDIRWQVFDGWSYAVGDVVLGNNPVSSVPESVAAIERTLQDVLRTFGIEDVMPHCVLSHIDVQAEVERRQPGTTGIWFQSIAGSDTANATFDITNEKMLNYAATRSGPYGLYFETGQGADFTNGHSHGYDMVMHESRKYGFARVLSQKVSQVRAAAGQNPQPWVHLNDVAGFIGPEVFRTRDQLVRCCLEDIVMGKLHGLCIGLDVCSTLHMDVSLDDLDWCLDQIMPANPAYLMALPTKIDPMLGYLTTGFQDHVRLREKFGYKVDDRMWQFFQRLRVIDSSGKPTEHFGDPNWVYLQYRRAQGDSRSDEVILEDGNKQIAAIRSRGVFVAAGHGSKPSDLDPQLENQVRRIYADAKESIWAELSADFVAQVPHVVRLKTQSVDRSQYILHPETGERIASGSQKSVQRLRESHAQRFNVQIVVSDGLNALAISDRGHLLPFLDEVRAQLVASGFRPAEEHIVVTSGRVRAGYRIGEQLFGGLSGDRMILHVIGERPGTGHHTFSVYITAAPGSMWGEANRVDHNITKVVSGIANTALLPISGAQETVRILNTLL